MKLLKMLTPAGLAIGLVCILLVSTSCAQGGYGRHHGMGYDTEEYRGGWSYCPYCGGNLRDREGVEHYRGYGRHHDRWGRGGYGMGPGMMGPGHGRWQDYPEDRRGYRDRDVREKQDPLEKKEARKIVGNMLDRSRNPNLKVGEIEEKKFHFVVDVVTQGGSLVDKLQVDKQTGRMRSVY
jgi:hypothetical protein